MRLEIRIDDFRSIRRQLLPADGMVVLFGPNSAGKTSVLEAALELVGSTAPSRTDPGSRHDERPEGEVGFTLPGAAVSGSPDADLFRDLLNGAHAGDYWAWADLSPHAADLLKGKTAGEAGAWIASRLADAGPAGSRSDREFLARAVLDPGALYFTTDHTQVTMFADPSRLGEDALAAARRVTAGTESDGDLLRDLAVSLSKGTAGELGAVADGGGFQRFLPRVIVLDGDVETLSAELDQAVEVIHDRMWDFRIWEPTGSGGWIAAIEEGDLAIGFPRKLLPRATGKTGSSDPIRYQDDSWLERMSESGEPKLTGGPWAAYGHGLDWFRVRRSLLAVAALIGEEANKVAPGFLRDQGRIGVEILPVSLWGKVDHRVRVTFTGPDGKRRDLRVTGAGTARWAAAAVQLACRRLEEGRRVVTDQSGTVVSDAVAARAIGHAAHAALPAQSSVRLEPADAPGIYIVDEPEAHLHPAAITSVRTWLEELAEHATAVLAATHSPAILDTGSQMARRILVLPPPRGTELLPVTGPMDDRLKAAAGELGITKGDLLLMTRLAVFVEGPHEVIILTEWFGDDLRDAGIRLFHAHGSDNFPELVNQKPGVIGSEIIGALGIKMAVITDTPSKGGEPTVKRIAREAKTQGLEIPVLALSETDILHYLDEEVCREFSPDFPGWREARAAARRQGQVSSGKWKKWITEKYGLDLSRGNIARLAAKCKSQGRIPGELKQKVQQLTEHARG